MATSIRVSPGTRAYLYLSLTIIAAIVLVPLLTTALGGFKSLGDLRVNPFGLPAEWHVENYTDILFGDRYWRQMMNSLIIALLTVFLTVSVSAMAAFTFAHVRFFGSDFLLNYFLIGLMFPAATAILPLFIRIRDLGLLNTYWGVVLPQVAFGLGMSILLLRNYFKTCRRNCSRQRWSTAAATCASSGTSPFRFRDRSSPLSASFPSSAAGIATSCR